MIGMESCWKALTMTMTIRPDKTRLFTRGLTGFSPRVVK